MKKLLLFTALIISASVNIIPQTWQSMGVPEGNGVTDLVYWSGGGAVFGDKLWATTGSVNWPTGQRGGVFYSAVSGQYQGIWYRSGGSAGYYVGRTLAVGQDGNLYASLWRDPAQFPADALCRFEPQAALFGLLYQAQAGDNIFSIAVKNNPHTIFGGTRNGVIRSTDNGTTFGYSNSGIPDSAWVFDIAIDSTGILAIASSKGVFITTDNGDNWEMATGFFSQDTVKKLYFFNDTTFNSSIGKIFSSETTNSLYAGTNKMELYQSFRSNQYLTFTLVFLFSGIDAEVADIAGAVLGSENRKYASIYHGNTGGDRVLKFYGTGEVYESSPDGTSWNPINSGLPPNPPVTALAVKLINGSTGQLYAGLFNDTTNGAGVYKLDITVGVDETNNEILSEYSLEQNFPNPFNPNTTIQFSIPEQTFVKLEVFNSLGEKVTTLVSEELNVGNYTYDWNAENLPSGIYYYTLTASGFTQTRKLVLLK